MIDADDIHSSTDDDDVLVTEPFVIRAGDYFNKILMWWLFSYGWTFIMPILTIAVIGIVLKDERIAITALVMIFIIVPMVMAFIFVYYMLVPEIRRVVLRKRVIIAHGKYVRLEYLPETDERDSESLTEGETDPMTVKTTTWRPEDETIMWKDVKNVVKEKNYTVFLLHTKRRLLIVVPNSAIRRNG